MDPKKKKENARLGFWFRRFNKRYKSLKDRCESLLINQKKLLDDKLTYSLRIDDLQLRLITSQGELLKTSSYFLTTLSKTQSKCTKIINDLINQNKELSKEIAAIKRKPKEIVQQEPDVLKSSIALREVNTSVAPPKPLQVNRNIDPKEVSRKKFFNKLSPHPRHFISYLEYCTKRYKTLDYDEMMDMEKNLFEFKQFNENYEDFGDSSECDSKEDDENDENDERSEESDEENFDDSD